MTALLVDTTAASGPAGPTRRRGGGGLLTSVRTNPRALIGVAIFLIFSVMAILPHEVTLLEANIHDPNAIAFVPRIHPGAHHWLGTTGLGQDVFAQLVYGARQSMGIALIAGLFATVLSVLIGVSAAYLGGIGDDLLSFLTDVFLVIPTFPLIIVLASYVGKGSFWVIVVVLVVTGWSFGARQLRAQTLSLRNRDFLESARVRGERRSYIIVMEVLPTMSSLILANFLGAAVYSVLAAAGLQFLGLGDTSASSWGTMLYWSQNQNALLGGLPAWSIAPGLCIALLGAAFALLNYAFDEISNPALRPVRRLRVKRADS
ncbi:MAG: peptide/nickel transport system permease protein [Actinomycetota bacterium]|jgi:peptide/nickel transport system permease protein|nr:peptide/nickel transport system permease protein [Actinomycetota bacterium]MDQ1570757.1 peptide/nickel transport system permease protein [Actinomycetota bacterium]